MPSLQPCASQARSWARMCAASSRPTAARSTTRSCWRCATPRTIANKVQGAAAGRPKYVPYVLRGHLRPPSTIPGAIHIYKSSGARSDRWLRPQVASHVRVRSPRDLDSYNPGRDRDDASRPPKAVALYTGVRCGLRINIRVFSCSGHRDVRRLDFILYWRQLEAVEQGFSIFLATI